MKDHDSLAEWALQRCLRKRASHAEIYLQHGESFSVTVLNGNIERITQAATAGLGLRVFYGHQTGSDIPPNFQDLPLK